MICAISPSASNYEESMSTLRYADRAKKIVNKATINESAQDKVIRELNEENAALKAELEKYKKMMMGGSFVSDMDDDMIEVQASELGLDMRESFQGQDALQRKQTVAIALEESVAANELEIKQEEKSWEERLAEQRAKDEEDRIEAEKLK